MSELLLDAAGRRRSPATLVGLGERERLVDPQAGAPEHDDQPAQPSPMHAVAGGAHDGDDSSTVGGSAG